MDKYTKNSWEHGVAKAKGQFHAAKNGFVGMKLGFTILGPGGATIGFLCGIGYALYEQITKENEIPNNF